MTSLSNCYVPLPITPSNLTGPIHRSKETNETKEKNHPNNRTSTTIRPLHIVTNTLSLSNGSCLLELGYTKILVSIHGPRSIPASSITSSSMDKSMLDHTKGSLRCQVRYAPFGKNQVSSSVIQPRALDLSRSNPIGGSSGSGNSNEELELSLRLQDALVSSIMLDKLPKCVVDVNVLILQGDGSILSAAIVASSMALADAGIECFDVISACTVAVHLVEQEDIDQHKNKSKSKNKNKNKNKNKSKIKNETKDRNPNQEKRIKEYRSLADPTEYEMLHAKGVVTLAMLANSREVTYWDVEGRLPSEAVQNALDICKNGCHTIHKFMREKFIQTKNEE